MVIYQPFMQSSMGFVSLVTLALEVLLSPLTEVVGYVYILELLFKFDIIYLMCFMRLLSYSD